MIVLADDGNDGDLSFDGKVEGTFLEREKVEFGLV
jgi:hypothetical protein